jgi:polar amino acid transport system substrate-binding protein
MEENEMNLRRMWRLLALLLVVSAVAAACGDSDDSSSSSDDSAASTTTAAPATTAGDDSTPATTAGDDSTATTAAGDAAALPDLEGRTVTVAVENAYLPFNYIDAETNEAAGWDYDAIGEICVRLNCTADYQTFAWEPMIQAVADGQFDMAADGITITDDRAQVVDFSDGYINIDQRMLVRVDEDRFDTPDALAADESLKIGSQTGTTNYDTAVELVGEDRVTAFEQFGFAVQALISGDVDAVIIDETAGQGYQGENADAVQLIGPSLSSDQLGFIFPKGSELVDPFNQAISAMKADGTMQALGDKYFSGAFTITYDDIADPNS